MGLLAASNWPLGVLLTLPVLAVLFFSAFRFAGTARARVVNLLSGATGAGVALIAFVGGCRGLIESRSDLLSALAPTVMAAGAALGGVLAVAGRRLLTVVVSPRQMPEKGTRR